MAGMTSEDPSKHVHVIVTLKVRPGAEERALAVFRAVVGPTLAEAACVRYEMCRAVEDPHRFVLVEEWRDQAGLDAHLQMPYIAAMRTALPEIVAEPLQIQFLAARP
jgi:quinol monooxygenase YgiN